MPARPLDPASPHPDPGRGLLRRVLWYREQLVTRGHFTTAGAAAAFECSERSVYRDLRYLETLRWDLEYSPARRCWVRGEGDLPFPVIRLRQGELVALAVANDALRAYAGTPYAAALESAFKKLLPLLDAPVTLDLGSAPAPRFTMPPLRALETCQFESLVEACRESRRLALDYYVPDRDEVTRREVDPYHVFAHGADWYLVAFDHLRGDFRTFALGERIRGVQPTGDCFPRDPEFDLDRYLEPGFGVFRGGEMAEVALRFTPLAARYMVERVWDETEVKEPQPDGGLVLRMTVPLNTGLLRFILQNGAEVEVLAPPALRAQVAAALRQALEPYHE